MKKKSCLNQESPLSRGITHLVLVFAAFLAFGPFCVDVFDLHQDL